MTGTIQNPSPAACSTLVDGGPRVDGILAARRVFLRHVAEVYAAPLTAAELDRFAVLDDVDALAAAFPWQSDVERNEALWAFGAGHW